MRVIAGEFRSRRILSLPGSDVRPTPDRLRETLFNILTPVIEGAVFMDAYAGAGSVGIEALSRGARHVVFIEKNREAVAVIRQNLASLGLESRARVISGAASSHVGRVEADIVFLDPPYPREREYQASLEALEGGSPKVVIAQHSARFALEQRYGMLQLGRFLKQGENALSFFYRQEHPAPES